MVVELFKKLGFSENEAKVYICMSKIGIAPPSTIASRCGLKRPNVFRILEGLVQKKLVLKVKQGNYNCYAIDDINKIYFQEKEKLEIASSLVQDLEKQTAQKNWDITYYNGKSGFLELYKMILKEAHSEFVGWVNLDEFYKQVGKEFDQKWTKDRVRLGIYARLIMKQTNESKKFRQSDKTNKRETRFLPHGKEFSTVCLLYDGTIIFFSNGDEPVGIKISNQELFRMQKEIFEMNWSQLQ